MPERAGRKPQKNLVKGPINYFAAERRSGQFSAESKKD
jgi:hypothetical protein